MHFAVSASEFKRFVTLDLDRRLLSGGFESGFDEGIEQPVRGGRSEQIVGRFQVQIFGNVCASGNLRALDGGFQQMVPG